MIESHEKPEGTRDIKKKTPHNKTLGCRVKNLILFSH